nr:ribonuclease H-like domain-containing protein [Tanacetum cinerariifolium]
MHLLGFIIAPNLDLIASHISFASAILWNFAKWYFGKAISRVVLAFLSISLATTSSAILRESQKEGSSSYTDEVIHSFFANQSSDPQLNYDDLEQINDDDIEEIDLTWQTKVECFHCHKIGHFARDCRAKGNQDSRRRDAKTMEAKLEIMSGQVEEDAQNYAMMDYSSSNSGSDNKSVFMNKASDLEDTPVNDRFADGMHAVPPPITGNYMPSGPDVEIDYSKFTYGKIGACSSHCIVEMMMKPYHILNKHELKRSLSGWWRCGDDPHRALKDKGIVDSGCSKHMTGNEAHLVDYQEFKGGSVAFGGSNGRITGKGKITTGRGILLEVFEKDHNCVACKKGKQHKASCKAKTMSSVNPPL